VALPLLYLLDTNILVHFVRGDAVWARVRSQYQLFTASPMPLISVVTAAELRSLALQNGWGAGKLTQMEFALGYFDEVYIDNRRLVDAYAVIDAHFHGLGQSLGKNDLWIATTAHVTGARLLTTDHDFDPLDPLFLSRDWIDPSIP
jgi:predicted nucleic acid-binding protein